MTIAWLRDLEERVQEASEHLQHLRSENERLEQHVTELEGQLESAPSQDENQAWTEEREEIRKRVERLVQHLDGLLPAS